MTILLVKLNQSGIGVKEVRLLSCTNVKFCILCHDKLRNLWTALKLQPRFALEHVYRYLQEKRRGLINEQEAGAIVKVTVKL